MMEGREGMEKERKEEGKSESALFILKCWQLILNIKHCYSPTNGPQAISLGQLPLQTPSPTYHKV